MLEVLLDALLDSVKALPVLFIVYILLELLEYKGVMRFEKSKMLSGKASPVFGSLIPYSELSWKIRCVTT